LTHFMKMLHPGEDRRVRQAAEALYYRDHIAVNLVVDGDRLFPDQWIYVHSPSVRMARITNYNNFSPAMVGEPNKTALSVEYFASQPEDRWPPRDGRLRGPAVAELCDLGLLDPRAVEAAWVLRETESYPTYYMGFQGPYNVLRARLAEFDNVSSIGRGGMYRYNNQD